jgi:hypothetical protein
MAYSGIEHCLLTQTIEDLFSIVLGQGPDSVALPQLFPFLWGSSFERLLFSLSWQQKSSLTLLSTANVGRAALATITPVLVASPILAAAGVAALPLPPRKMQKTSHQEQIAWQNERKRRAVQGQAHARRIAICGLNWTGYPGQ